MCLPIICQHCIYVRCERLWGIFFVSFTQVRNCHKASSHAGSVRVDVVTDFDGSLKLLSSSLQLSQIQMLRHIIFRFGSVCAVQSLNIQSSESAFSEYRV